MPTPLTGHCDLPEYDKEFSTIIFIYNETASLTETAESVKGYRNPARVMLATVIEGAHMIIFQMNREAYLQVCMYLYNMCALHTVCDLLLISLTAYQHSIIIMFYFIGLQGSKNSTS